MRHMQNVQAVTDPSTFWDVNIGPTNEAILHEQTGYADHPQRVAFREWLRDCGPVTLLDCGAGPGWELDGIETDGLDVTYTGLEITERFAVKLEERGIEVLRAGIESIPAPNDTFDVVYARHVLEHVRDMPRAVAEMVRVAKQAVYICNHNLIGPRTVIGKRAKTGLWHNVYCIEEFMAACDLPPVTSIDAMGHDSFCLRLQ